MDDDDDDNDDNVDDALGGTAVATAGFMATSPAAAPPNFVAWPLDAF